MFRPLPVRDGNRLVRVERWFASERLGNGQYFFTEPEYRYVAEHGPLADLVAASFPVPVGVNELEALRLQTASPNYFDVLGTAAAAGRMVTAADAEASLGVVLSYPSC